MSILIVVILIYVLFPLVHVILASLIIQVKIIINSDFQKRYCEIKGSVSKLFYINMVFDFILFAILSFIFIFIFYKSLSGFSIIYKIIFFISSCVLLIFDIIFFSHIDPKELKDIKSRAPLFSFPSLPLFYSKKNNVIANPMSSPYYWIILVVMILIIYLNR